MPTATRDCVLKNVAKGPQCRGTENQQKCLPVRVSATRKDCDKTATEVMLSLLIHVAKKENLVLAEKEQLHVCGVAENHQARSARLKAIIPDSGASNVAETDTASAK